MTSNIQLSSKDFLITYVPKSKTTEQPIAAKNGYTDKLPSNPRLYNLSTWSQNPSMNQATSEDLNPTLSVIIPTFNRSSMIVEALNSLVEQSYRPLEIVVVDDGSTDGTPEILENFSSKLTDSELTFKLLFTDNQGAPKARNLGFRESSGTYISFMDSDDLTCNGGFSVLLNTLKDDSSLDFAYGRVSVVSLDEDDAEFKERTVGETYCDSSSSISGYHWHTMGAVYSRALLNKVGPWNEKLTGSQDWEFQGRVKLLAHKRQFSDCLVGYWRQHSGERVGTSEFRKDYVQSVIKACFSIWEHCEKNNVLSAQLQRNLGKKVFRHSLEFGAHGAPAERDKSLKALAKRSKTSWFNRTLAAWRYLPSWLDRSFYNLLQKTN